MNLNPSNFTAFIDESGCSGDQYANGSSAFLAMGAVIIRDDFLASVMDAFDEAREERQTTKAFKKFSKESDKTRFVLSKVIASKRLQTVFVAIHKPSMSGSYIRDNHANEYNYLLKMLIERFLGRSGMHLHSLGDQTGSVASFCQSRGCGHILKCSPTLLASGQESTTVALIGTQSLTKCPKLNPMKMRSRYILLTLRHQPLRWRLNLKCMG